MDMFKSNVGREDYEEQSDQHHGQLILELPKISLDR